MKKERAKRRENKKKQDDTLSEVFSENSPKPIFTEKSMTPKSSARLFYENPNEPSAITDGHIDIAELSNLTPSKLLTTHQEDMNEKDIENRPEIKNTTKNEYKYEETKCINNDGVSSETGPDSINETSTVDAGSKKEILTVESREQNKNESGAEIEIATKIIDDDDNESKSIPATKENNETSVNKKYELLSKCKVLYIYKILI